MNETVQKKLKILADAAKYDVSCASSGSRRQNSGKGLGNGVACGICHSFTEDGRCVSLLKILLSNHCIYDCAYCINRRSNDRPRATFTVDEIVDLTINFYRRNYIEGLFLSSGVMKNPDYTMERLMLVAKKLRNEQRYYGYIHLKAIPGANDELIRQTGFYVDRLSVNIEIPSEQQLKIVAPEKDYNGVLHPMSLIKNNIAINKEERKKYRSVKNQLFTPAGQSTQLIIGATPETDRQILALSSGLYKKKQLKRVYFSGYIPVNNYDDRLPAITQPPMIRENRLYQSDWLMRFYQFGADEILDKQHPNLDLEIDPKLAYALRNMHLFPIDINKADYEMILRIPGVGVRSAQMIVHARRFRRLNMQHLKKIGVVLKRAKYFITCNELPAYVKDLSPQTLRRHIITETRSKWRPQDMQLSLFHPNTFPLSLNQPKNYTMKNRN